MSPTGPCHGADKHEPRTLSGGWPADRDAGGLGGCAQPGQGRPHGPRFSFVLGTLETLKALSTEGCFKELGLAACGVGGGQRGPRGAVCESVQGEGWVVSVTDVETPAQGAGRPEPSRGTCVEYFLGVRCGTSKPGVEGVGARAQPSAPGMPRGTTEGLRALQNDS